MPPGSAKASNRAATLTPSPKISPSSTATSPTLMPMRYSMRLSAGVGAFRWAIPACTSTAQRSASTTLPNSMSNPSPVVLTSRPLFAAMVGLISSARIVLRAWRVPPSSVPISREYPATSAAKIAARRRIAVILLASRPCAARRNRWLRITRGSSAPRNNRRPSNRRCSNNDHLLPVSGRRRVRQRRLRLRL
jgi:hypothetical protein